MKQFPLYFITLCIALMLIIPAESMSATREEADEAIRVMKKAIEEKNDPMRNRMYFKLRQIGGNAVAPLVENLNDPNEEFAGYCAFVLGWIADVKAVEPLVNKLKGSSPMKMACARALGNMAWGTPEKTRQFVVQKSLAPVSELLKDMEVRVRRDAAYSLGLMGDEKAIQYLREAEKDTDELVRWFATEAINRIRTTKELFLKDK